MKLSLDYDLSRSYLSDAKIESDDFTTWSDEASSSEHFYIIAYFRDLFSDDEDHFGDPSLQYNSYERDALDMIVGIIDKKPTPG